ncbi:hypothetical protein D3C86_1286760 [compost metagenome]
MVTSLMLKVAWPFWSSPSLLSSQIANWSFGISTELITSIENSAVEKHPVMVLVIRAKIGCGFIVFGKLPDGVIAFSPVSTSLVLR